MSNKTVWCVGRNFDEHARELGNPVSRGEPLIFLKPASAIAQAPNGFLMPRESRDVHPEVELVFRISREIRGPISVEEAWDCVDAWAVGLDWTARDLQSVAKSKGHPWTRSKGFRQSATLGSWQAIAPSQAQKIWSHLELELLVNDKVRQRGRLEQAVFNIAEIISSLSQWTDLQMGDVVFTGTPAGVAAVDAGDKLNAIARLQWEGAEMFSAISLRTRKA